MDDVTTQFPDGLLGWQRYFRQNALVADGVDWCDDSRLSDQERHAIARSIAAFQLGEYSEGKSLMQFARVRAAQLKQPDGEALVDITRHFIHEEQNHAALLGRFMEANDIERFRSNWTDSVFRRLRKNAGFHLSITVLITAEIIALTYYRALSAATDSRQLQQICSKIIADERAHVRYESGMISAMRRGDSGPRRRIMRVLHRLFFLGTVIVVYLDHITVIPRGGLTIADFWADCWHNFNVAFPDLP
jgi:hypothetical protein